MHVLHDLEHFLFYECGDHAGPSLLQWMDFGNIYDQ